MISDVNSSHTNIIPLQSFSELCEMAHRYSGNEHSLEEITSILIEHYVLGYEVSVGGKLCGFAYAVLIDGIYTLDGHNEGVSIFTASKMGKMVCNDLFGKYTDIIHSVHYSDERHLHALVRRIGFKKLGVFGDRTAFVMEKSWAK